MLHVLVSVALIALVLIQHGKGADIGASFGSGASSTVFGSQGTGGVLFKTTSLLAMIFFITSLTLAYMVSAQYTHRQNVYMPVDSKTSNDTIPIPSDAS